MNVKSESKELNCNYKKAIGLGFWPLIYGYGLFFSLITIVMSVFAMSLIPLMFTLLGVPFIWSGRQYMMVQRNESVTMRGERLFYSDLNGVEHSFNLAEIEGIEVGSAWLFRCR